MQNKVMNHIVHNKIAYIILAILLGVIGFTFAQTPNFSDQALSGNVGDVTGVSGPGIIFTDAQDFTVTAGQKITLSVVTQPQTQVSFWLVHSSKKERPLKIGMAPADASGVAVFNGVLPSKAKLDTAYRLGVQSTSATGTTNAVGDFTVTVTSAAATSTQTTTSAVAVTLVTADGSKLELKQGDSITAMVPATITSGVKITMQSTDGSFAPVTVAEKVTGTVTWTITNQVSGAFRVNVTDANAANVAGVTFTVTDGSTGVTTGMASTGQMTVTSDVTSPLESGGAAGSVTNDVTFTSPRASTEVKVGEPVVVSFTAKNATDVFTLHVVDAAGSQAVVSKAVTSGQSVTWVPVKEGVYRFLLAGSTSQVVSEFTVTVTGGVTSQATSTSATSTGTVTNQVTSGIVNTSISTGVTGAVTSDVTSGATTTVTDENGFAVTTTTAAENEESDKKLILKDCSDSDPLCGLE